jgi:hypothetical protein
MNGVARCDIALADNCPAALAKTLHSKDPAPCQACATAHAVSLRSVCPAPELASICKCEAAMAAACGAERAKSEWPCALCVLGHVNALVKQSGCLDPELQGFCTLPLKPPPGPAPPPGPPAPPTPPAPPGPAVNCTALLAAACPDSFKRGYNKCYACAEAHLPAATCPISPTGRGTPAVQAYCTPPEPHYPPGPPYVPPPPAPPLPTGQCIPDRNVTVCGPLVSGCVYSGRFGPNYNTTMHPVPVGSFTQCPDGAVCPFCEKPDESGVCSCPKPVAPPPNKRRVNWYTSRDLFFG